MKALLIATLYCFVTVQSLNAQSKTAKIFNKTVQSIRSLKSVQYGMEFTEKNPFSQGDVSKGSTTEHVLLYPNGTIKYKIKQTNINSGQSVFKEIYTDGKLYSLNMGDSTYTEEVPKLPTSYEMTEIASMMESELRKDPSKIIHKRDTVFNGKKCYNFFIKSYDTVSNGNHDYTHKILLIDQKTSLPIYVKQTGAGTANKGGISLGRINFYSEKKFDDIILNKSISIVPFVDSGFRHPNTEMLKVGDMAPALFLKNLSGTNVSDKELKNKILLVVFGAITCPANPLANPMLNRLHSKFSSEQFSIINVYSNETSEQVNKYIKSNQLNFPVYLGNKMLSRAFKTVGTPDFYLIDKNGKVSSTSQGYKKSLEQELTGSIVKLLKTSF